MPRYRLQSTESRFMISARSTLHAIESESRSIGGYIDAELGPDGQFDLSATPKARIEIAVEELRSGNPLLDREMRRRVDPRRYPTIVGELTGVELRDPGRYRMTGDVTFRGITKPYRDEVTLACPRPGTIRLEGHHIFDLNDFDFEPPRIALVRVYPDVDVSLIAVARQEV